MKANQTDLALSAYLLNPYSIHKSVPFSYTIGDTPYVGMPEALQPLATYRRIDSSITLVIFISTLDRILD